MADIADCAVRKPTGEGYERCAHGRG